MSADVHASLPKALDKICRQFIDVPQNCQEILQAHDTNTSHRSETNGIAEESFSTSERRNNNSDGSKWLTRMVGLCDGMLLLLDTWPGTIREQGGPPKDGSMIPFGPKVNYKPISAKSETKLHQFGRTHADGNIHSLLMSYVGQVTCSQ